MQITIKDQHIGVRTFTVEQWASDASRHFPMDNLLPGVAGEAFDFNEWYASWRAQVGMEAGANPTHLKVRAADAFEAIIPWSQLQRAAFMFAIEGKPLKKGYPIRLYVPNGSSDCLHVKSVVQVEVLYEPELENEAVYGFSNEISIEDMKSYKGV